MIDSWRQGFPLAAVFFWRHEIDSAFGVQNGSRTASHARRTIRVVIVRSLGS
jgi:hypothetical protein